MLTEEFVPFDSLTILLDGQIQVREATYLLRDGVRDDAFPPRYHRYVLTPGADMKGRHDRIQAIAKAVWTKDILAAFGGK